MSQQFIFTFFKINAKKVVFCIFPCSTKNTLKLKYVLNRTEVGVHPNHS